MKFAKAYFTLFLLIFFLEIIIARYLQNGFIRFYGGDFLIVILIYCFIKSFADTPVIPTALGVLFFAYAVEISQYFHLVRILGLQHSKIAVLILGTTFSFTDILLYTLGIGLVILVEKIRISLKLSF